MITRRWCLSCFDDYAEDTSRTGLCMACDYEHDRSLAIAGLPFGVHNESLAEWWGPKLQDINDDDIEFGFYETTIGIPEFSDDEEDEQWATI